MIRPSFIYIGIARAGSTWLFEMLRGHPDIFVPPAKDLYFFDRHFERGMDWYLGHFSQAGRALAVGELSHDYYQSAEAAERIRANLPDVKLILTLREPVDRLVSGYLYNRTTHLDGAASIEDYIGEPRVRSQFDYLNHLRRYLELFPREQILILFFEDLKADPVRFLGTIYRFLGVDDSFLPDDAHERINPAREARAELIATLAYRLALFLRGLGLANLVGRIKASPVVNRLLYRPLQSRNSHGPVIPPGLVAELRRDHDALEALIGRPLPESWRE